MKSHRSQLAAFTVLLAFISFFFLERKGCSQSTPSAREAAAHFVAAVESRDRQAIFSLLSQRLQKQLRKNATRTRELSGGGTKPTPLDMLKLNSDPEPMAPKSFTVLRKDRDTALVKLVGPYGENGFLHLIYEQSQWRVDSLTNSALQ